jgi:hypothetical protein
MVVYSHANVRTYEPAEADAKLKIGSAVAHAGNERVGVPTSGSAIAGIVVRDHIGMAATAGESRPLPVCYRGVVWVTAASDVKVGQAVRVAVSGDNAGALGATAGDALPGAQWRTEALAGALAQVELNLP